MQALFSMFSMPCAQRHEATLGLKPTKVPLLSILEGLCLHQWATDIDVVAAVNSFVLWQMKSSYVILHSGDGFLPVLQSKGCCW